jgi:hypothetical protein
VKRSHVRGFLVATLLISSGFAAWTWFRPYEWRPDPAAACIIKGAQVREDHSFYWVDVHLKVAPDRSHDLMKPVRLVATSSGKEFEPADTTLAGNADGGTTDLWFKFWLERADLEGALKLQLNDGALLVKSTPGLPRLGASKSESFPTHRW